MRYADCQRADGNCAVCALVNYGRDCNNNPVSNLAYYRGLREMTMQQVADAVGKSRGWVGDYEAGRRDIANMTLGNAVKLARALGVSAEELLDG